MKTMRRVELFGGPKDGAWITLPDDFCIAADDELHIAQDTKPITTVEYRWLFGAADHLDFAGWLPRRRRS